MIICTTCGTRNDEGQQFCRSCGSFLEWTGQPQHDPPEPKQGPGPTTPRPSQEPPSPRPSSAATPHPDDEPRLGTHLSAAQVAVEPGGTGTLLLDLHNRGSVVDQVTIELLGPVAAWSTVEPSSVNLLPDARAQVVITFSPPRSPEVPAGTTPFGMGVRSKEHPPDSVLKRGEVLVGPFRTVTSELGPTVLRGSGPLTTTLTISNGGNVPEDVVAAAEDPEDALGFEIAPRHLHLEPGSTAEASLVVTPLRPMPTHATQTRPFLVTVTGPDGTTTRHDGTYVQPAAAPAPPPEPAPPPAPVVIQQQAPKARRGCGCGTVFLVVLVLAIVAAVVTYLAYGDQIQAEIEGALKDGGLFGGFQQDDAPAPEPPAPGPSTAEPPTAE